MQKFMVSIFLTMKVTIFDTQGRIATKFLAYGGQSTAHEPNPCQSFVQPAEKIFQQNQPKFYVKMSFSVIGSSKV